MTRNKHFRSVFAALLCAVLCMTAFATVAYADGGDYYDDELPPETWQEETQPEDNTIVPGTPFTEDGIAATRDLLYDKHTNKQFITVETKTGNVFYLIIDRDGEEEMVYFLTEVTENDLLNATSDNSETLPKNSAALESAIPNGESALPNNNGEQADTEGKETETEKGTEGAESTGNTEETEPEPEVKEAPNPMISYVLIGSLALIVIGAAYYFKVVRKKKEDFIEDEDEDEEDNEEYENEDEESEEDTEEDFFDEQEE